MVAPVSTAVLIFSASTPNRQTALLNFILEITFFTIRMVIEIDGPLSGGSSDRCSESHSNSTLRSLSMCSSHALLIGYW